MNDNESSVLLAEIIATLEQRNHHHVAEDIKAAIADGVEAPAEDPQEGRRRRRASASEALSIAVAFLHERLVVFPAIATATQTRLAEVRHHGNGSDRGGKAQEPLKIEWRADTEFVRPDRAAQQEFDLWLAPQDDADKLKALFAPLTELLPREPEQ